MEGDLLVDLGEVVLAHAELLPAQSAEVDDLLGEGLHGSLGDAAVLLKELGVVHLQGGAAAGAEADDVVVVAVGEGLDVLERDLLDALALAHHVERQAAAGLLHREIDGDLLGLEDLAGGNEVLGIDEVLGAAGKDGHTHDGVEHLRLVLREDVAEGLVGNGRQRLEVVLLHEHHRQVALELRAAGEGTLGLARELQEGVEHLPVGHDRVHEGAHGVLVVLVGDEAAADLAVEARQVDAAGANVLAGFAAHAVLAEHLGLVLAVVEVGQDEADGADVDVAHLVAADEAEHGTDVGARAAAHASEDLVEERILGDLAAAVVEEDHVHDLAALGRGGAGAGAAHPGHVGGQALGRAVAGQDLQGDHGVVDGAHQLVEADEHRVDAGHGLSHAGVAFVGHRGDGAVLGDGEVAAGHAHVGLDEFATQLDAGDLDQAVDVGILLHFGHLGEIVGDLVAAQVDGRHDHVGRCLVAQLDDVLAKVGLVDDEAVSLQLVVELGLFGSHRLGLHDALDVVLLADVGNDLVGFGRVLGEVHVHAALFSLALELLVELVHVSGGFVLELGDGVDKALLVDVAHHLGAVFAVGDGVLVQRLAELLVVQRLVDLAVVLFIGLRCLVHD